jgi:hypothetical protein
MSCGLQLDCKRIATELKGAFMRRKNKAQSPGKRRPEDAQLSEFMENIWPKDPILKIYRVGPNGKQTLLGSAVLDSFSLDHVRHRFGSGTFLLRTVRSNGTYGPSRVVHLG